MNRRHFLGGAVSLAAVGTGALNASEQSISIDSIEPDLCGCNPLLAQTVRQRVDNDSLFKSVDTNLRVTDLKVFGVSLTPDSDRPYVFVKIETNQGLVGWGEATLEGKAGAAMACVKDFRDFVVGKDPTQVQHIWESMYVHSFYRAGPVIGSAMSGIDQALWDLRGKALGVPVYKLLGGPFDPQGVRGYYHAENARTDEDLAKLRETAASTGVSCFKVGLPGEAYEWIETSAKIDAAVKHIARYREKLGDKIDIAVDFHAKTSPSVASILVKEVEPLHLLFVEEPCPPENVPAMQRIARRSTTPIATGERLMAAFGCRELIEKGVVDILQTDINHTGGVTGLWKVAAMANYSNISMAPHACEGPIGGLATLHVDSCMPNFLIQEICSFVEPGDKEKIWAEWFGFAPMRMVNGKFPLPQRPGLGFELSESALAKYPFGGTRPMARVFQTDGSVGEW
jgi:galactonate dehydratase